MATPRHEFLVVGAGITGATVARVLADAGRRVLVVDGRPHPGGNCHDAPDAHGILVHTYGPHVFHTRSKRVWGFLSRFTSWRRYQHRVAALVGGRLLPFPINLDTVNAYFGLALDSAGMARLLARLSRGRGEPIRNSRDAVVARIGPELFDAFYRDYTLKQWGVPARRLDARVCGRIPVRLNRESRYFTDCWQGVPCPSFTAMFVRMLGHPGIEFLPTTGYADLPARFSRVPVVYTGRVDEYFGYRHGPLAYRSVRIEFQNLPVPSFQPVAVVNCPDRRPYTRVTEYRRITGQTAASTTISHEYPGTQGEPAYPVPSSEQRRIHRHYLRDAAGLPNVVFAGRLGAYRYLNMDEACREALAVAAALLARGGGCRAFNGRRR